MEESQVNLIIAQIRDEYGAEPEFLWPERYPTYCIFRHGNNKKWFALVGDVSGKSLGMDSDKKVDIINLKFDNGQALDFAENTPGVFPAYHMNKQHWISVLLDGTVALPEILDLIDISFRTTASKKQRDKVRPPKDWLIPANPKYYDVIEAFRHEKEIRWKQGAGIRTGDTVFMYVAAPVSAILYRCKVTQTDIPYRGRNKDVNIKTLMMIRLEKCYDPQEFTFRRLNEEFNIFAVRGPRSVPNSLLAALA